MSVSGTASNSSTGAITQPMKYLDKAVVAIRTLGIPIPADEEAPVISIVAKLESIDPESAASVARVLQKSSMFNAVVRDHIDGMSLSDRYQDIAEDFDSIRIDSRKMLDSINDGKFTFKEKIRQLFMKLTRGSISSRYQKIRKTYLEVAKDSREQIHRERTIIEAYVDFRMALKSGEVVAYQLYEKATTLLNQANNAVEQANIALAKHQEMAGSEKAKAEMARDEAMRSASEADKLFQLAKDIAEQIKISYSAGEVVMARLQQTTDIKERVYQRAVTFFSTNETVFTGLNAATSSVHGLNESTRALNAMESGINAGIEDLADIGGDVLKEGVKAGYGAGISPDSVQKLVDSVVNFQEELSDLTSQLRSEATSNAKEIASIVEEGKQRFVTITAEAE